MKLLISGATGFIGRHLTKTLLKEGHRVSIIVRKSTNISNLPKKIKVIEENGDIDTLIKTFKKQKFDGVIHLASLFLAHHQSKDIPALITSNVLFGSILLEASEKAGIPWFINTGTFWQHYQNKDYSPGNIYAATKQAIEAIAQYYIEAGNINFVTLKLSDTFGPEDTRPKIFNLWLKNIESKITLEMSPGEQIIDINYIDNVISGFIKMTSILQRDTKRKLNGKSFVISAKKLMTLKELSKIFEKVSGETLSIDWGKKPYRLREVMVPWNKGNKIPGWKPTVTLEDGIRETLKYYKRGKKM